MQNKNVQIDTNSRPLRASNAPTFCARFFGKIECPTSASQFVAINQQRRFHQKKDNKVAEQMTQRRKNEQWWVSSHFYFRNFFPFPSRLGLSPAREPRKATKNFRQQQVRPLKFHFRDSSCVFGLRVKVSFTLRRSKKKKKCIRLTHILCFTFFSYIWYGNGLVREVKNRRVWRRRRQRRGKREVKQQTSTVNEEMRNLCCTVWFHVVT